MTGGSASQMVRAWFNPLPAEPQAPGDVRIGGWVFDEAGPLEGALLVAGVGPATRPRLGIWRQDVGDAFPAVAHAGASGFEADIDLRAAPAGPLRIALLVRTMAGNWEEAACTEVAIAPSEPERRIGRPRAAFTIAQNEPLMLPVWLDYYSRYFDPQDLYVIDHDSSDGSTSELSGRCRVVPVHRTASFDHRWLRSTVESFQRFLLQSYETVLFAEVDELVVADPSRYTGLDAYIDALERPAARCSGFNVVHQPDEPPLRFGQPLLAQRRYWHASLQYSKRLLSRVPLSWSEGFHVEYNAPDDPPDPALMLVHLHRIDYDSCLAHHRSTASRNWSEDDIARGDGAQNRIAASEEFERWFRDGQDLDAPRELIPEHIRAVL